MKPRVDAATAALDRLAATARLGIVCTGPRQESSPALAAVERDVALLREVLADRATAWRIADAASEAATTARRRAGFPMGGPEA